MAPTVFVCCGPDPLTEHAKAYREKLEGSGVPVSFRLYEEAMHGFIEVNHKEYPPQEGKNARQEALARDAETYIAEELRKIWNGGAE